MAKPALTAAQQEEILTALRECVVAVRAGTNTGTGFFIAAGQVLTCRHVIQPAIREARRISVAQGLGLARHSGEPMEATLRDDPPFGWPDAAILTVPDATDSRCVVIDSAPVARGTPLLTAGYPTRAALDYQVQRFTADDPRTDYEGHPLLQIAGHVISPGMSGGPVVNLQSGLVCGILTTTRSRMSALGGFASLFADFIDQFPDLVGLNNQPPEEARDWLRILTAVQLKHAGRDYRTGTRRGTEATSSERPTLERTANILSVDFRRRKAPPASLSVGTGLAPTTAKQDERSQDSKNQQARLFISYSHRDERYLKRLEIHLASLRREGIIAAWHDQMIMPGEEWRSTIGDSLESADFVLLLITPDFIASDYCYSVEMERALERHREGGTLILPVIVRPANWERTPLGELQALPKNGKPVIEWSHQDRAWLDVTRGLRNAVLRPAK
jgi:hypothetical protein